MPNKSIEIGDIITLALDAGTVPATVEGVLDNGRLMVSTGRPFELTTANTWVFAKRFIVEQSNVYRVVEAL